mgnify:CR=1 FL=1
MHKSASDLINSPNNNNSPPKYIETDEKLKNTIQNKIIDDIIPEPFGGAHRHPIKQSEILKEKIISLIKELKKISIKELVQTRKEKYLNITSDI